MKNKHFVLIERNTDYDSPVIAAIKRGEDQNARIIQALQEHFDCEVTNLVIKIDEHYRGKDEGSFQMGDDDQYPTIHFDIYPLWIY